MNTNEYGKLIACIVGDFSKTPFPKNVNNIDVTYYSFYNDNIKGYIREYVKTQNIKNEDIKYASQKIEEARKEDLDNLAKVLEQEGIKVYRPLPHNPTEINSPNWTNVSYPAGNVRDNTFIYKNWLIETSSHLRGRIFENEYLYEIFYDYLLNKNYKWVKLPQSSLKEENLDQSWYGGQKATKPQCIFDAAQILKFDEGLVINYANENHLIGIKALSRIIDAKIYPIAITDNHIDGMIIPVDEKTILINPKLNITLLPDFLQKYDKILVNDKEDDNGLCLASENILINCISIGNKTVIINRNAVNTIKELEKRHFTVIPIRFRYSRIYSGGIHCSTLDIERHD